VTATSTTFLEDIAEVVKRGSAGGAEAFADQPVWALPMDGDRAALRPVERVGLTPNGQIVVLFRTPVLRSSLILPSSIR
jgi:hypothetical protein